MFLKPKRTGPNDYRTRPCQTLPNKTLRYPA